MIISEDFEGDNNLDLTDAQYRLYGHLQCRLFTACSDTLCLAADMFDLDSEYIERLKRVKSFDHRVLQDAHDILAANYRFQSEKLSLPLLDIPKSPSEYESEWLKWFEQELVALLKIPDFVRGVTNAVLFQNSTMGYMSEDQIARLLVAHYKMSTWQSASRFVKAYTQPAI